jgi:hypothetical protein
MRLLKIALTLLVCSLALLCLVYYTLFDAGNALGTSGGI